MLEISVQKRGCERTIYQSGRVHTECSFHMTVFYDQDADLEDPYFVYQAFLVAQWKRIHLPMQETQETWVLSLGWEDPLEKENSNPLQFFLLEKCYGQSSLAGYSPWSCRRT